MEMWEAEDAGCMAHSSHKGTSSLSIAFPLSWFFRLANLDYKQVLRGKSKLKDWTDLCEPVYSLVIINQHTLKIMILTFLPLKTIFFQQNKNKTIHYFFFNVTKWRFRFSCENTADGRQSSHRAWSAVQQSCSNQCLRVHLTAVHHGTFLCLFTFFHPCWLVCLVDGSLWNSELEKRNNRFDCGINPDRIPDPGISLKGFSKIERFRELEGLQSNEGKCSCNLFYVLVCTWALLQILNAHSRNQQHVVDES